MISAFLRVAAVASAVGALAVASAPAYASSAPAVAATSTQAVPNATINGCPSGFYCFYQDANFGGRRVQFQSCGTQNLTDFGFNDEASSWVNNTNSSWDVFKDINRGGGRLWHSPPNSRSSFVGSAANDQASSFTRNC
jgi:hypothetical protein